MRSAPLFNRLNSSAISFLHQEKAANALRAQLLAGQRDVIGALQEEVEEMESALKVASDSAMDLDIVSELALSLSRM